MRKKPEIPIELDELKNKFDHWRKIRTKRNLPEDLWKSAVKLSPQFGVSRVSRALGLNPSILSRRVRTEKNLTPTKKLQNHSTLVPIRASKIGSQLTDLTPQFLELPPMMQSRRGKTTEVRIHLEANRSIEVRLESPDAKDWADFFSGLFQSERRQNREVLS
jgi:hypothetical protein